MLTQLPDLLVVRRFMAPRGYFRRIQAQTRETARRGSDFLRAA